MTPTIETPPLESIRLLSGAHESRDDGMCLLEAVACVAGEPHTDHPQCVCPVLAAFGRGWNDGLENDDEREKWLKPFLTRLVGTRGSAELSERRAWMALDWLIRVHGPAWMDLTESLREHAAILRALPPQTSNQDLQSSKAARAAARAAAWEAAWEAAGAAAGAAAGEAAGEAARAAAREAAQGALTPTKETLKASADDLFDRMIRAEETKQQ